MKALCLQLKSVFYAFLVKNTPFVNFQANRICKGFLTFQLNPLVFRGSLLRTSCIIIALLLLQQFSLDAQLMHPCYGPNDQPNCTANEFIVEQVFLASDEIGTPLTMEPCENSSEVETFLCVTVMNTSNSMRDGFYIAGEFTTGGDVYILDNCFDEQVSSNSVVTLCSSFPSTFIWDCSDDIILNNTLAIWPTAAGELCPGENIDCKVTNKAKCKSENITMVDVDPLVAEFEFECVGEDGLDVVFTNTSYDGVQPYINYEWDFGDCEGTSNNENPFYSYEELGSYYVQLIVTDSEGVMDTFLQVINLEDCSFDDNIPIDFSCNADINLDLEACNCEAIVEFEDPIVNNICDDEGYTITRTDGTGLNSGDVFPVGITVISYLIEDKYGNSANCSFEVNISSADPGSIFCNVDQNISLDQDCVAKVTPMMMVKDPACDIESYRVTLFNAQGIQLPSDTITAEYLGEVVTARVSYGCYENSCSVRFNVEDKMPPMIDCEDITITCSDFIDFPLPIISDNCGSYSPVLLNQIPEDVACQGTSIDRIITRTYGVRDESGDIVQTCDQRLSIMKFDISEVEAPELVVMISCDSSMVLDDNGNPDPSMTGAPSLNGIDLFPQKDLFCNVALTYEDMVFTGNGCGTSLLRTWTVTNWYCGEDGMVTFKQSITVIDTVGPEFANLEDITISSASTSCETPYEIVAPLVSDNCQDDIVIDIIYPGGIVFDTNRASAILDLGDNLITYRANDQCGNVSEISQTITVEDQVQPVAVCESGMSFSLDGNGMAILTAMTFDNGSLDECSDAILEIAKMSDNCGFDDNLLFGSNILLCCEDVGQEVMVILRVTDDSGNSNQCMASIEVVDGSSPVLLSGLPDITISNDYIIDTSDLSAFGIVEQNVDFPGSIDLTAEVLEFDGPSVNAIVLDNCSINTVVESKELSINMCQTGEIVRTFVVSDASGIDQTIVQNITVVAERVFSEDDISFPDDTVFTDQCNPDLATLALNSFPIYDDSFNSMVSYTKEDDTISYISPGCFMVDRIWYVSDWCNRIDGQVFSTFVDTQRITVLDEIDPQIIEGCGDTIICSLISGCGDHPVNFSVSGSDNCTEESDLVWSFVISYADDRPDSIGVGNNFTGDLPIGSNTIRWSLGDGCGNTDECSYEIEIESCLNPQPICFLGQEFYISPIDTSGDMIADTTGVRLTASMINAGSFHPCSKDITVSFSEDVTDTVRIFGCDELGDASAMLYVTDEDGRFDFCNASFSILDTSTNMLCGMGMVAGVVFGNEVDFVAGASVELQGSDLITMTDENGIFEFPEMSPGGAYSVVPSKEDLPLNGVSTADLVIIQRHILGISRFDSPYKLLAADVNESGHVSASDLIAIRKLILGINDDFPSGKTWKFVPGDHVFVDPTNPWSNPIPEKYDIHNLVGQNDLDFIGVKLGDVNESAQLSGLLSSQRSLQEFTYRIENNSISIVASQDMEFAALLVSMDFDMQELALTDLVTTKSDMILNYNRSEDGNLRILINSANNVAYKEGEVVISLEFENKSSHSSMLADFSFNDLNSDLSFEDGNSSAVEFRYEGGADQMTLKQNVPNPWTGSTSFGIIMPSSEVVSMRIFDVSGKEVLRRSLELIAGENVVEIKDSDLPTIGGMYFYEISSSFGVESRKMMIIAH